MFYSSEGVFETEEASLWERAVFDKWFNMGFIIGLGHCLLYCYYSLFFWAKPAAFSLLVCIDAGEHAG